METVGDTRGFGDAKKEKKVISGENTTTTATTTKKQGTWKYSKEAVKRFLYNNDAGGNGNEERGSSVKKDGDEPNDNEYEDPANDESRFEEKTEQIALMNVLKGMGYIDADDSDEDEDTGNVEDIMNDLGIGNSNSNINNNTISNPNGHDVLDISNSQDNKKSKGKRKRNAKRKKGNKKIFGVDADSPYSSAPSSPYSGSGASSGSDDVNSNGRGDNTSESGVDDKDDNDTNRFGQFSFDYNYFTCRGKVVNIVFTGFLNTAINLKDVQLHFREKFGSQYTPKKFAAIVIRFAWPKKIAVLLFGKGKMVITGPVNTDQARFVMDIIVSALNEYKYPHARLVLTATKNLVVSADLILKDENNNVVPNFREKHKMDLDLLAKNNTGIVTYVENSFPGAVIKPPKAKPVTTLAFKSWKFVIIGATMMSDIFRALTNVLPMVFKDCVLKTNKYIDDLLSSDMFVNPEDKDTTKNNNNNKNNNNGRRKVDRDDRDYMDISREVDVAEGSVFSNAKNKDDTCRRMEINRRRLIQDEQITYHNELNTLRFFDYIKLDPNSDRILGNDSDYMYMANNNNNIKKKPSEIKEEKEIEELTNLIEEEMMSA